MRELFDYDPETGVLRWRNRPSCGKPWNAKYAGKEAGCVRKDGYRVVAIDQHLYLAHRLIWLLVYGRWPRDQLDHINGNVSDNRLSNLREVTQRENNQNMRLAKNNCSGRVGVSYDQSRSLWKASIKVKGVTVNLGRYATFDEAVAARSAAEWDNNFHPNHGRSS